MADYNFEMMQGTTRRFRLEAKKANQTDPYDFTGATVRVRVQTSPIIDKVMIVNGSGVVTSTDGVYLGRPDPTNPESGLVMTAADSGHLTVEFFPAETASIVAGTYQWECRVEGSAKKYTLQKGTITIRDSLFDVA